MDKQEKRGPGRPSQGKIHIDMTLTGDVVELLRSMKSGERSKFVEECIKQHPSYIEWRKNNRE